MNKKTSYYQSVVSHWRNVTAYILKLVHTGRQYLCSKNEACIRYSRCCSSVPVERPEQRIMDPTMVIGRRAVIGSPNLRLFRLKGFL